MTLLFRYLCVITCLFYTSCQNGNKISEKGQTDTPDKNIVKELFEIKQPYNANNYKHGDRVEIRIESVKQAHFDSIILRINKSRITRFDTALTSFNWNSVTGKLGTNIIEMEAYSENVVKDRKEIIIKLTSSVKPKKFSYKVLHTYTHSRNAYTQGLIYENGIFYESCGEYNESTLRKVNPETGESVLVNTLENKYFAEGLAQYKNKLYQISWKEQTAFVYDKTTFKLERKFNYTINEGWGLEFDGTNFIMTDGSNILYFVEPEYFNEVRRVEVIDNNGPVNSINELELVDGKLFANVYMTDRVIVINPETGVVEAELDFTGLLPKADYTENTNVLNGIAYNKKNKHFFITGKNWPKLFEIEILRN